MTKQQKLTRLLAPTVPLKLEAEGVPALELKLAWTMRAIIGMERRLRELGIRVNVVQNPGIFWAELSGAVLAAGVWACSWQEQPQYADADGYDVIESYMTPENYGTATAALKDAFLESLSKDKREKILAAIKETAEEGDKPPADPTGAPPQEPEK